MTSQVLPVIKIVATGNDFVFINGINPVTLNWPTVSRPLLAKLLCDRHFGVGADGLVIVEADPNSGVPNALRWDFYNSDGSTAEMCGNATRCYGRWVERVLERKSSVLITAAGVVEVNATVQEVESTLAFVKTNVREIAFAKDGQVSKAMLINTGVPHAVFEVADISNAQIDLTTIQKLRFHPETGPRGANVTLLQKLTNSHFKTVTFERGVENFTLSCGTGVLAAAIVGLGQLAETQSDISTSIDRGLQELESFATLETPGGRLSVRLLEANRGVVLSGPAEITFETKIDLTSSLFARIYGVSK